MKYMECDFTNMVRGNESIIQYRLIAKKYLGVLILVIWDQSLIKMVESRKM